MCIKLERNRGVAKLFHAIHRLHSPGHANLHDPFSERSNVRKHVDEFYRDVKLEEVEEFVKARGVTAQFVRLAEAREYRETQAILVAKEKEDVSRGDDKFPQDPFSSE